MATHGPTRAIAWIIGTVILFATLVWPCHWAMGSSHQTSNASIEHKVNINTATFDELIELKGIGETIAKRIIEYREKHGPFQSVDDLINVKGIGERKLNNLRPYIRVE